MGKGSTSVSVDLSLSPALPGALAHTDTKVTATATNGDSLFCVEIKTAPAMEEFVAQPPAHALAVAQLDREPAFSDTMMKAFVGAGAFVAADAARLKLTWADCGGQHVKITGFSPDTVTTGQKTTMTGTGNLDEDVSAANFDLEMKTAAGTVSCKGDAGTSKTCNLPLGTGSLTFNAMSFPIKKGSTSVSVDLSLSAALPGALAHTDTKVTATATNGDGLFCVDIKTAPAEDILRIPLTKPELNFEEALRAVNGQAQELNAKYGASGDIVI